MDRIDGHREAQTLCHSAPIDAALREVWSAPPRELSNRGLQNVDDIRGFATGLATGVIDAGGEFIEFLAKKGSVTNSLLAIGPALDTAVNYYADKLGKGKFAEVINDIDTAYGAIAEAAAGHGSKSAFDRGKCVGNVTFAFALAEVAPAPVKTRSVVVSEVDSNLSRAVAQSEVATSEKLFMDSGKFADDVVRGTRPGWGSTAFNELLKRTVDELPAPLKDVLLEGKVHVQQAKYTCDLEPAASSSTLGCYQPEHGRIVIAEKITDAAGKVIDNPDLQFTVAHEVAHVLDCLKAKEGVRLSQSAEFRAAFEQDRAQFAVSDRGSFQRYFSKLRDTGRAELFADAVAVSLGFESLVPNVVPNLERCLPNSLKWVREQLTKH